MATPAKTSPCLRFGVFQADLERGELRKFGTPVRIQEKPLRVLAVLLERPGEIVTREELRERLWPADTFVEFDDGLNAAVKKLRAALNDTADRPHFIETVPRRGYRFVAPLTAEPAEVSGAAAPAAAPVPEPTLTYGQADRVSGRRWLRLAAYTVMAATLTASVAWGVYRRTVETHRAEAVQETRLGRELWRHRTAASLTEAIDHYNKAVELDPANAAAYSGLADAYIVLPFLSTIKQDAASPKAKAAAEQAVRLAPRLAEAHTSLAYVKLYVDWDFAGAEIEFQRALALDPNDATAHQWYAEYLSLTGRHEEAIREVLRAEQLEPLSLIMYHEAGQTYQNARQYDNAIRQYERALEFDSGFYPSCGRMAEAYLHKGMIQEWIETQLEFYRRHDDSFYFPGSGAIANLEEIRRGFASGGTKGYWRARLQTAKAMQEATSESEISRGARLELAIDYAQSGDSDNAMRWLEAMYSTRDFLVLGLKVDPDFDPLRADPRFQALIRRIGLP